MSRSPSQPTSAFASLPLELIEKITRKLPTRDIVSLRQTCSLVEHKMRYCFAVDFMSKKQFMVSTHSLNALQEIARDETFSSTLRHLIIGTDQFDGSKAHMVADDVRGDFLDCWADQANILVTGQWRAQLTEALKSLPNLATIDIRDFNSKTRYRDGPEAVFRSLGSTRLADKFGDGTSSAFTAYISSHMHNNMVQIQDIVFQNTLLAMAESGTNCKSIEVITRHCGLQQSAFTVTPATLPVIEKLEKLHIVMDTRQAGLMAFRPLKTLLAAAKNLKSLRINMNGSPPRNYHHTYAGDLEDWISGKTADTGEGAIPCPTFKLERLELGIMDIHLDSANALFDRFAPTLKNAVLWKVTLSQEPSGPTDTAHSHLWVDFLRARKAAAANGAVLGKLELGPPRALHERCGYVNAPVYFLRDNINLYRIEAYKGTYKWDQAVKDLVVQVPPSELKSMRSMSTPSWLQWRSSSSRYIVLTAQLIQTTTTMVTAAVTMTTLTMMTKRMMTKRMIMKMMRKMTRTAVPKISNIYHHAAPRYQLTIITCQLLLSTAVLAVPPPKHRFSHPLRHLRAHAIPTALIWWTTHIATRNHLRISQLPLPIFFRCSILLCLSMLISCPLHDSSIQV
jgi:hypothetical protein